MQKLNSVDLKIDEGVKIAIGDVPLYGELKVPEKALGVVIFAHGSGSGRHSPRNQAVAAHLREHGLGTLLFDLLTRAEEAEDRFTGHLRFNIPFLGERLVEVAEWARQHDQVGRLPIGFFGASTGAAAALVAAAKLPKETAAVVSRGGRPDLAMDHLRDVECPVLLIVGEWDKPVIEMNERAFEQLRFHKEMKIVPRATHLFEEPGALELVSQMAAEWFVESFKARY